MDEIKVVGHWCLPPAFIRLKTRMPIQYNSFLLNFLLILCDVLHLNKLVSFRRFDLQFNRLHGHHIIEESVFWGTFL